MTSAAPSRGRPGRRPTLSREDVVRAARQVVEADGFEALSLRAVARRLGVSPMNLYTYVDDAEQLEALVIDQVVAERVAGLELPADWRACLLSFAEGLHALVSEHPAMVEAYARGAVRTPTALQVAEVLLDRLAQAGIPDEQAVLVYEGVHALVLGHVLLTRGATGAPLELPAGLPRVARALRVSTGPGTARLRAQVELLLASVDPSRR